MTHARTWVDEVTYLIKSWTYVTGTVAPYSDQDPTWYMPLYFYELGLWQKLLEPGLWQGRLLSAILGALNGLLIVEIVRRITGNLVAGALAAAVFLSIPAVTFYFGTATPIATVSLLVLVSVWLVITGLGRAALWRSLCLGILLSVLYFYRQNMVLVIVAIAPLYILGLRQSRLLHSTVVLIGMFAVAAPLILFFPDRLISYAMRLPVVTPVLADLGLIKDPLLLIEASTVADMGLGLAFTKIAWPDIVDAFVLPYAGLILTSVTVFFLATGKLRVLTLAPVLFFYLAAVHYLGSLDYC